MSTDSCRYQTPNCKWLQDQFKHAKLGSLKASELEVYLAFMLMSANGDLEKDVYALAEDYGMTEAKIRKLKVEFAKRFMNHVEPTAVLSEIANDIFEGRIPLDKRNDHIVFAVYDAVKLRFLRQEVEKYGHIWGGDIRNSGVVDIPSYVFAAIFGRANGEYRARLTGYLKEKGNEQVIKELFTTKNEKRLQFASQMLKDSAKVIMEATLGFVTSYVGQKVSGML